MRIRLLGASILVVAAMLAPAHAEGPARDQSSAEAAQSLPEVMPEGGNVTAQSSVELTHAVYDAPPRSTPRVKSIKPQIVVPSERSYRSYGQFLPPVF